MGLGSKKPVLRLGGDARGATKAMTTVNRGLHRMKDVAKRVGSVMKKVLMAPFKALKFGFGILGRLKYHLMGLIALGGLSIRASIKQKLAIRELQMAADAMGYSWDEWGGKLTKALSAMQKFTNYGDEEMAPMFTQLLLAGMKPQKMLEDMPRILDLCAAAGYDMASGSEYIARAWTGEYTILKRNLPVIAGLITAMDTRKKALGRELTQLEKWNMMMSMATSKLSGLAAETRKMNPFPALLNEIGDNLEKIGDFLSIHVNPQVERLTKFFEKLKELKIGAMLEEAWKKIKTPGWLLDFGKALTGIVYDAVVLGFQTGLLTVKKILRDQIGMPIEETVSGAKFVGRRALLATKIPGEIARRVISRATTAPGKWQPFGEPAWAQIKPTPVYAPDYTADRQAALDEFTTKFAARKATIRQMTAPIIGALQPAGQETQAELMRKFLMNQTTAAHRGQLAGII